MHDPEIQKDVAFLYESGMTYKEVSEFLGVSFSIVQEIGLLLGISRPRRHSGKPVKTYRGKHKRVENLRGKPRLCENCGTTTAMRYEWANVSGNYDDPNDFIRLCVLCHRKRDWKPTHSEHTKYWPHSPGFRVTI